jgi:hypothetical protein
MVLTRKALCRTVSAGTVQRTTTDETKDGD